MKKTLFVIAAPTGDTICFSPFLKDYKDKYPDEELYVKHIIDALAGLFQYNEYVKPYDSTISYDKIYEYNLYQIDPSELGKKFGEQIIDNSSSIQAKHYFYLNSLYNFNVERKTLHPIIQANTSDYKIESDKPICLINPGANYLGFDTRFWGINNYQKIIDTFKDKINFISIGSNSYNGLLNVRSLKNVYKDLINQTSMYETLCLINQADFILTHESGLYHAGCIPSDKIRHVIVPAGSRMTYCTNTWTTKNVIVHWLENENKELYHKHCFKSNENSCHHIPIFSEINIGNFLHKEHESHCKMPVFYNGEILSHCLYDIKPERVISLIENILNKGN